MTSLLIIAISSAVSLIAGIAVDYYLLLKRYKVGSEEYDSLMKFARNNKKIRNYHDIFEDIYKKLSALEKQLSDIPVYPKSDRNVNELKKEIEILKNAVNDFQFSETEDNNNTDKVKDTLIRLTNRVFSLENKVSGISAPVSVDTSAMESEIELLKKLVDKNNAEIESLKQVLIKQQQIIELLKKEHKPEKKVPSNPAPSHVPEIPVRQKVKVFTSSKIITPDAEYVKMLISNIEAIKNILGVMEYRHYKDGLENLLDSGDFDDGEEIMGTVHELIEKYIYGSDTKVSVSGWAELEKYIINAGYVAVPVKAGDDVTQYKSYFSRPIPADGEPKNTIKQIQLQPYVLTYKDNGEKETVKLCGKCTYYK